ncbi:MAG: PAS domain-containing methyl-accepting chemotaxis protein [Actinomycetota bacterium]
MIPSTLKRRAEDVPEAESNQKMAPPAAVQSDDFQWDWILSSLDRSQAVIRFTPEGIIQDANENFLSVVGYSIDEIRGNHHKMFVEPRYGESEEYREFWASLRRGEFKSAEFQRFGKGGAEAWIQATYNPVLNPEGEVVAVVKFATDITRQRQQQREIQDRSQAIIEFKPDGTIITANTLFTQTVGYRLDEIAGQHHRMFMPPEAVDTVEYNDFWPSLARGEFKQGEFRRQKKNGEELWLLGAYNPVIDNTGRVVKVVKSVSDITEQVTVRNKTDRVGGSIANSVSEMTSAIGEIAENINRSAKLAQDAEANAYDASTMVGALNNSGEAIGQVVGVIQRLSEQTNMLALNATIEAARAGEAGRGFAVVANEVKGLATQTGNATDDISSSIEAIQNEVSQVVAIIQQITDAVSEVSETTTTVAAAVEEQSYLMSEINKSAEELIALTS